MPAAKPAGALQSAREDALSLEAKIRRLSTFTLKTDEAGRIAGQAGQVGSAALFPKWRKTERCPVVGDGELTIEQAAILDFGAPPVRRRWPIATVYPLLGRSEAQH
jgi:hypothetical protein